MDNHNSIKILIVIAGFIVILTGSAFMGFYPGGSPGGYSGSPLDGKNCTHCHTGTPTTIEGIITSNIDSLGYVPGSNYTITVSVPGSGLKGFEVSPLNTANQKTGTLTAGIESRLVNSGISVTHSITSGSDPAVWTFQWKAPVIGTGNVTFYGAFAASKSHTLLSTMVVKEKTVLNIAPEISSDINVVYNPDIKKLIFKSNKTTAPIFSANIYSIYGEEVMKITKSEFTNGRSMQEADVSGLRKPGIFILKYYLGKTTVTKKIYIY